MKRERKTEAQGDMRERGEGGREGDRDGQREVCPRNTDLKS